MLALWSAPINQSGLTDLTIGRTFNLSQQNPLGVEHINICTWLSPQRPLSFTEAGGEAVKMASLHVSGDGEKTCVVRTGATAWIQRSSHKTRISDGRRCDAWLLNCLWRTLFPAHILSSSCCHRCENTLLRQEKRCRHCGGNGSVIVDRWCLHNNVRT